MTIEGGFLKWHSGKPASRMPIKVKERCINTVDALERGHRIM
jgi:hypothetical protein